MLKAPYSITKYLLQTIRIIIIMVICQYKVAAQVSAPQPPQPSGREVKRYEIDAKRIGVDANSEDALPRSREFKRIDSTYYVGWLFEGAYKYNHAADYAGYKNAAQPLERALKLIERDYRKELALRSPDLVAFYPTFKFKLDYSMIGYYLLNCYNNMDDPMLAFNLLQKAKKWNMQRDFYLDIYNYLGWTIHRNRYYTSARYPFLKNTIDENEQLANKYLDSGIRKIQRDKITNRQIFPPGYEKSELLGVYHYKTILYGYALNIDSTAYYYGLMRESPYFPHNNYATFKMICGDFRTADAEYKQAAEQEAGDKRLKEYIYYGSIIDLYKGLPKTSAALLKDVIAANGSTPGFGWYNIALARSMYYDGNITEAKRYIDKAAQFKELHIGTTLGQSHYDFCVQLNKLMNKEADWEMERFEHADWWYNPKILWNMTGHTTEKYMQQFLIINQLAQNPERDRVIYKLFSTESTVTWDEVWYLIKDFSTKYFLNRFQQEAKKDDRKYIHKYYELFIAKLLMEQGKYKEAKTKLNALLNEPNTDTEYEKLYAARLFEAEAKCAKETGEDSDYRRYMNNFFQVYPQLIPYCGMKMDMSLHIIGADNKEITERLKECNINFTNDLNVPKAYITYTQTGNKKSIQYTVTDATGNTTVTKQGFSYTKPEDAAKALAYRLFNINSKDSKTGK